MQKLYRYCLALSFLPSLVAQQVSPTINDFASRVFGQPKLSQTIYSQAPNLVEGREFNAPQGIAFDTSVTPPILYVSDLLNNRVLAWRNATSLSKGNTADFVVGQRAKDFTGTLRQGPGSLNLLSTGLAFPGAIAVDKQGNLYVCDTGNNRILRYPAPFNQTGDLLQVDLVIGQKNVSTGNSPNEGNALPSAKTVAFSSGNSLFQTGLAFDPQGNLWVSDPVNNRVLRFPIASLSPNTPEPAADIVLGQVDFVTGTLASANRTQTNLGIIVQPAGLAFDQRGNLYVADGFARVLYFQGPLGVGTSAVRVLGVNATDANGKPLASSPNSYTLGIPNVSNPAAVFTIGNNAFVVDSPVHRIVHYDVPENWPAATTAVPSPPAIGTPVGQSDFLSGMANKGKVEPDSTTLAFPTAAAFNGTDLWVVDTGNNRVLSFPQNGPLSYFSANRLVGQLDFSYFQPNLVEGREVNFANVGGGVAFDRNSNPPHLYIADLANNRVLGFRDARNVVPGTKADLVIGQPDIFRSIPNYPNGPAGPPTDSSLLNPVGVAVDANGNLYVADFGNSRILRFPSPFTQPAGLQHANLVLGQSSFSSTLTDPSAQNMAGPWGLVFLSDGSLVASDAAHNRVLVFKKPSQGDFTTFQRASNVIGQNDFNSRLSGNGNAQLNNPRHMGVDTSDRLYVADSINGRVQIFALGNAVPQTGLAAALTIPGLSTPQAVTVSPITGEAFIANTNAGVVLRVPEFTQLLLSAGIAVTAQIVTNGPLDVALDANDNLVVAEAINRVTFFFAKLGFQHAATYNNLGVAPGQLLLLNRQGKDFSLSDGLIDGSNQSPWPANLGDIQVTVNGMLSPIFHIIPGRIDMQVPQNAPSTGTADFLVTRVSTGEILGAASIPMVPYNPGFFTLNASGFGQLAATDQTGKVNGPATSTTSPIKAGTYITLYGTGLGVVPNAPPDGVSPSGAIPAPNNTQVLINGPSFMDLSKDGNAYSGLGAFPGGWQINVKVPSDVACGGGGSTAVCTAIPVVVLYNQNYTSNIGLDGRRLTTTITTTQQSQ